MGRSEWKRSARLMAGRGFVAGVGCEPIAPAEDRRELSLNALSLRSIMPGPLFRLPSPLTAALLSPRLVVNTFKQTLRGGISSDLYGFFFFFFSSFLFFLWPQCLSDSSVCLIPPSLFLNARDFFGNKDSSKRIGKRGGGSWEEYLNAKCSVQVSAKFPDKRCARRGAQINTSPGSVRESAGTG